MDTQTLNNLATKFTQSWWKNFESQTEDFSTHFHFKQAFTQEEVDYINYLVGDIIRKVTSDKKRQSYLRIWKNGKYDKLKTQFFKKNPISETETILEWKNRTFGEDKFGLFLNHANNHSEELSELLLNYLRPYIESKGIPTDGFSTTIILGDYGWTPLGIHRDKLGEYIIHFHLGPGEKDIYIWNKDKSEKHGYVHLQETKNFDDFINDYSYKSSFGEGDIFSMLGKNVHIGNTHQFSIGLVVEFNRVTEKELLEKMWFKLRDDLFDKNFNGNKAKILPSYTEDKHSDYLNFIDKGIKHYNIETRQSIKNALKEKYLEHKYTLLSNNGFSLPPYIDHKKGKKNLKKINIKSSIQLIESYQILFYKKDNDINLFIRGDKFKIKNYNPNITSFINKLNEGSVLTVEDIKNNYFNEWDNSSIFKLLYSLYKRKGIKIQF